ncbi:uncharacterized protein qsm [Anabrus simplex]|uniref:uncharacterized protein qsm n=1 Tax=Anabrus simplex TaxID=316456 RepID=UPI0035A30369
MLLTSFCFLWISTVLCSAKIQSKVRCSEDEMLVELVRPDHEAAIYLQQMKHYPDKSCQPEIDGSKATFRLSLSNVYQCGVTRVFNQVTGLKVFYHTVVVESPGMEPSKELLRVKCVTSVGNHTRQRRDLLPAGFQEEEVVNITRTFQGTAPVPELNVGVRQGGQEVTGELNVNPGTPLQMEIFLDKNSAPIYGLLVSYMQVSDTKAQEETIIFNGCSVDPYLFENFNTVDGDFLSAKFRAFKFPESTYVLFKGTVNVCLDKCRGVECSNGQVGYGRKRREVNAMPADPNKVFEVTMTTFIKVNYEEDELGEQGISMAGNKTQILSERDSNALPAEPSLDSNSGMQLAAEEIREQFKYTIVEENNAASAPAVTMFTILLMVVLLAVH